MSIELRNATKEFSRTRALDSISISFEPGELVALTGLKGAGKSTLLRALSGSIGLTSGELLYDSQPFSDNDVEMQQSMLFIPDTPPLLGEETVLHNISLFLTQYGKTGDPTMGEIIFDLLKQFKMVELAETTTASLSRDQAWKVILIILAAINPRIWILDEPLDSGMDENGIRIFRELARNAVDSGSIVIYSTRLIDLEEDFATRICLINNGKNYACMEPEKLKKLAETDHLAAKLIGKG